MICIIVSLSILLTADFLNAELSQRNAKIKLILNSTYEIEDKIFTLKNGNYSDYDDKIGEGMRVILQPNDIICDDLTIGGLEGAIVKLGYNTGGMGTFYIVAILRYDKDTYRQVFHIYAGTNYEHITFGLRKNKRIYIKVKSTDTDYIVNFALSNLLFQ